MLEGVTTGELNRFVEKLQFEPPLESTRYQSSIGRQPLCCSQNAIDDADFSGERFVVNRLRDALGLRGLRGCEGETKSGSPPELDPTQRAEHIRIVARMKYFLSRRLI